MLRGGRRTQDKVLASESLEDLLGYELFKNCLFILEA